MNALGNTDTDSGSRPRPSQWSWSSLGGAGRAPRRGLASAGSTIILTAPADPGPSPQFRSVPAGADRSRPPSPR